MANEAWIERQTRTPEARRRYEEERLILWTTEAIAGAMEEQDLSRADVAEKLGTSRAHVTQLLNGSRNMTVRSLASLAYACGMRADTRLERLTDDPKRKRSTSGCSLAYSAATLSRRIASSCKTDCASS